jgi:hypothetical protein
MSERCGCCYYWMTDKCPNEKHLNGRSYGPDMYDWPCELYERDNKEEGEHGADTTE